MIFRYCRHCKKDVPMFDNDEFEQLTMIYQQCVEAVKEYRRTKNTTLLETPLDTIYQPFYAKYKELAGVQAEFNVEEIMRRHYLKRWRDYQLEANVG